MGREGLQLDYDPEGLLEVASKAPMAAYRHFRAYVFGSLLEHRLAWLKRQKKSFGRKRKLGKSLTIGRVGQAVSGKRSVAYEVPLDKVAKGPVDAVTKLQQFRAEISTPSRVLEHLEFGGEIRGKGRLLSIPIRTRGLPTPRDFQRKYPKKRLILVPRKKGGFKVYEANKKVIATRISDRRKLRKIKQLRYLLVPRVKNKPTLKFYRTWDQLRTARDLKLRDRTRRMVEDMEKANA